jgi:hypothetical protein
MEEKIPHEATEYERIDVPGVGRHYLIDGVLMPSVTTVIGTTEDKQWLNEWRDKVGAEFADAYTKKAADIGTALHYYYECLLRGEEPKKYETDEEKQAFIMFRASKLNWMKTFKRALLVEHRSYSRRFQVAGTFDANVEMMDSAIVLSDFKNTKRDKGWDDIEGYRLQLAFYDRMLEEHHSMFVPDYHLVFMVNRDGYAKRFRFNRTDTTDDELHSVRKTFAQITGSVYNPVHGYEN